MQEIAGKATFWQATCPEQAASRHSSAWAALPLSTLRSLMLSMPKRVDKVLQNRGAYIGY